MARRSRDWNEGLAQDLQDQEFAREFLLVTMAEGVPIQVALGKVILAMGVKEFAERAQRASPNVLRAINPRHNPSTSSRGLDKTHVSRYRSLDAWVVAKAVDEQTSA